MPLPELRPQPLAQMPSLLPPELPHQPMGPPVEALQLAPLAALRTPALQKSRQASLQQRNHSSINHLVEGKSDVCCTSGIGHMELGLLVACGAPLPR